MTRSGNASPDSATTRAHCNLCGGQRNHDVIAVRREEYEDSIDEEIWICFDAYEMLQCRGCESVKMRHTNKYLGDNEPRVLYYPPAIARRTPVWLSGRDLLHLPMNLFPLLSEVYSAVQNNLRCVAAMGIRAILETVMRSKVGEQRTFKELVDKFQQAGYLSTRQAGSLDAILEAGHAAIHRAWEPTDEDIADLLDITEAVIETTYLHERRAQGLEKRVPRRTKPS